MNLSERDFQKQVIQYARIRRWLICHFDASVRVVGKERRFVGDKGSAGFPDLVLCRDDRLIFAELKSEKGKLSPNQEEWLTALRRTGIEVFTWRPSDWPSIENILR